MKHSAEISKVRSKLLRAVGNAFDRYIAQANEVILTKYPSDIILTPTPEDMKRRALMDEFAEADAKGKFWRPRSKSGAAESA